MEIPNLIQVSKEKDEPKTFCERLEEFFRVKNKKSIFCASLITLTLTIAVMTAAPSMMRLTARLRARLRAPLRAPLWSPLRVPVRSPLRAPMDRA